MLGWKVGWLEGQKYGECPETILLASMKFFKNLAAPPPKAHKPHKPKKRLPKIASEASTYDMKTCLLMVY